MVQCFNDKAVWTVMKISVYLLQKLSRCAILFTQIQEASGGGRG